MVASNLTVKHPEHAAEMIRFALRAQEEASKVPCPDATDGSCLKMRIGEISWGDLSINCIRRWIC